MVFWVNACHECSRMVNIALLRVIFDVYGRWSKRRGCWNVRLVRDAEDRRNAPHLYYMLR